MYSMAKPYLYMHNVNIMWISSHPLVNSFIVFKYVNLIQKKEKYILERISLYFGRFGEKLD